MVVLSLSSLHEATGLHIHDKAMYMQNCWRVQAQYSFFRSFYFLSLSLLDCIFSDSYSSFFQLPSLIASASIVSVFYINTELSSMLSL